MSLKNKIKMFSVSESGRSMIEMLGVLAIIGVLSIGAVAGYKFALNKFRANEIINELNARALSVSAQMLSTTTPYESDEVIEDGFGNTLAVGYSAQSAVAPNPEYFKIFVDDIPSEVCIQILRDYENPIMIFVNEVRYNADTSICATESSMVDMSFAFRRDLGERETCSDKGYFGEEDFMCHCSGNTGIDPNNPNECICPGGYIWDADAGEHGECIFSRCPEGQFESLNGGCVPCDDEGYHKIATGEEQQKLCTASTCGRIVSNNKYCIKNTCAENQFFTETGGCYNCGRDYMYNIYGEQSGASCRACRDANGNANMMWFDTQWCVRKDWCPKGTHFLRKGAGAATLYCMSCDTDEEVLISDNERHTTMFGCNECRDTNGNQSRIVVKKSDGNYYCLSTQCSDTEFKGADGACHACNAIEGVIVGDDTTLQAGCTACGREIVNGVCQLPCKTGEGLRLKDGSCYPCGYYVRGHSLKVSDLADGVTCESCPNRIYNYGYCVNKEACPNGFMDTTGAYCYACSSTGINPYVQPNTYTATQCEACGYHVANGCCIRTSCVSGKFWAAQYDNTCYDCSLVDAIKIGTHEVERQACNNCTGTARFWAGEYCYRCDTAETPDVFTDEEIQNCERCHREVKDGKCVLKQ